jgi:hypothetical protein
MPLPAPALTARSRPRLVGGLRLVLTVVLLAVSAPPAAAVRPAAQGPGPFRIFFPFVVRTTYIFLPVVLKVAQIPLDLIVNPSFENTGWFTDASGNQEPFGWTFFSPGTGQTLPFPTKQQDGGTVPAISGGQGEYVHKFFWQLPEDEWLGGTRGLILDGTLTYKIFSDHLAHALRLSQTLTYAPGRWVRVTGYLLGETQPFACSGSGVLEDDHFIGSVQLGGAADTRFYSVMRSHFDVANNTRAWNKFSVTAQVPGNGQLPLVVIAQSNWPCPVDFFVDNFQAFEVAAP